MPGGAGSSDTAAADLSACRRPTPIPLGLPTQSCHPILDAYPQFAHRLVTRLPLRVHRSLASFPISYNEVRGMKNVRYWAVGLTVMALLAVGMVALAGNGFGGGNALAEIDRPGAAADCSRYARDADGDGIPNCEDSDWARPADGTGYGEGRGCRMNSAGDRPLDGSGFGARRAGRMRSGGCV